MDNKVKKLTNTAMCAVLNYVAFAYGKINIPIAAGGTTAIHIANAVVVLSAWLLGPVYGGLASAVGLSIADVLDPRYITSAPKTFVMKFLIAFIAGKVAEKIQLHVTTEKKAMIKASFISALAGLAFNVIVDPVVGYLYKHFILGIDSQAVAIIQTWSAGVTALNAVVCVFIDVLLYFSLYKTIRNIRQ